MMATSDWPGGTRTNRPKYTMPREHGPGRLAFIGPLDAAVAAAE